MTIPLIVLAVLSIIGGFVNIPEVFTHGGERLTEFLSPVVIQQRESNSQSFDRMVADGINNGYCCCCHSHCMAEI